MRPVVAEGFEPRCWYSPTEGYFLYKAGPIDGEMYILRQSDSHVVHQLPDDVQELGSAPTQWAYDQACAALKKHRERADNIEGRIKVLEQRVKAVVGGDWIGDHMPLEVGVDALIHLVRLAEAPPVRDTPEMINALHIIDRLLSADLGATEAADEFLRSVEIDPSPKARAARLKAVRER